MIDLLESNRVESIEIANAESETSISIQTIGHRKIDIEIIECDCGNDKTSKTKSSR